MNKILVTKWWVEGCDKLILEGGEQKTMDEAFEYFQDDWSEVKNETDFMSEEEFKSLPEFSG